MLPRDKEKDDLQAIVGQHGGLPLIHSVYRDATGDDAVYEAGGETYPHGIGVLGEEGLYPSLVLTHHVELYEQSQ